MWKTTRTGNIFPDWNEHTSTLEPQLPRGWSLESTDFSKQTTKGTKLTTTEQDNFNYRQLKTKKNDISDVFNNKM